MFQLTAGEDTLLMSQIVTSRRKSLINKEKRSGAGEVYAEGNKFGSELILTIRRIAPGFCSS